MLKNIFYGLCLSAFLLFSCQQSTSTEATDSKTVEIASPAEPTDGKSMVLKDLNLDLAVRYASGNTQSLNNNTTICYAAKPDSFIVAGQEFFKKYSKADLDKALSDYKELINKVNFKKTDEDYLYENPKEGEIQKSLYS